VTRCFARDPTEIAAARQMVRAQLEAWGVADDRGLIELAVSELVTNAVVHGRGLIEVNLSTDGDCIRLDVVDQGTTPVGVRSGGRSAAGAGGWGLRLVERVSDEWGARHDGQRTHVWMERRVRQAQP
jgi:anti-sigma regulatory factor (Ser/Thr protein kinase)